MLGVLIVVHRVIRWPGQGLITHSKLLTAVLYDDDQQVGISVINPVAEYLYERPDGGGWPGSITAQRKQGSRGKALDTHPRLSVTSLPGIRKESLG